MTMTLDEARKKVEERWSPHPDVGDNSKSATGEYYTIITSGGVQREGGAPEFFPTEAEAIDKWLAAVLAYGESRTGTLYWRTEPELEAGTDQDEGRGYTVYSRLLISARPVIQGQRSSEILSDAGRGLGND